MGRFAAILVLLLTLMAYAHAQGTAEEYSPTSVLMLPTRFIETMKSAEAKDSSIDYHD